ncbi:MAG: hypothetical protein FWF29_00775 [Treponema sp.]|nr:hypothetical protein [Treponema sp.]
MATPVRSVQNQPAAKLEIGKVDWFLPRTADIRKNWLSLDIGGIGPRYERMLGHKISLGTFAYWVFPMDMSYNCFGADASFNFYPWGKTFYLGTSLGFFYRTYSSDEYNDDFGLSITPEIGWKIDIGKPGGFYMKPGFAVTFFVPGGDLIPYLIRLNWGIGYAF